MSGERIFFWPDRPGPTHYIGLLMQQAGWAYADHPADADWSILHRDTTWIEPGQADPWEAESRHWINGGCRDISKALVQRLFAEIFGYPLAVDPLTWTGAMVQKADRNFVKDAVILQGPITSRVPGQVYERLLAGPAAPEGRTIEHKVFVVGAQLPAAQDIAYLPLGAALPMRRSAFPARIDPRDVLDLGEIARILQFCRAIGMDYGKVDIIRNQEDGRIYIIDANNTPGTFPGTPQDLPDFAGEVIRAFHQEFGWSGVA